jgi:hypothetical protein
MESLLEYDFSVANEKSCFNITVMGVCPLIAKLCKDLEVAEQLVPVLMKLLEVGNSQPAICQAGSFHFYSKFF